MSAPTATHTSGQIAPPASLPDGPEPAWSWLITELAGRPVPPLIGVIGLGDGSLLEALDAKAPGAKVLALEPDPVAARAVLAMPLTAVWRQSGRLVYLSGPDYAGADNAWRIFPSRAEAPPMLVHPSAAAVAGVAKAVSVFKRVVSAAGSNARKKFAPRYLLNSLKNLPSIVNGRDVRALTNAAIGVPAVVVGAGPSLDESIGELARLRNRAFVIATDASLRPLLTRGIVPHLVVGLDPSELNARHLLDLPECRNTWLVAEAALDPRTTATFEGRTFWFRVAPHHPWPWYNEQGIDVGRLDVWGSVLTAAFQVAHLVGCDPIVTVGADLSFPSGRPYARGTTYEFDWAWSAALGTPIDQTWRALLAGLNDLRTEKDVAGIDTPTTGVMLQFRDWMVMQARKSGRRVVNACGAGMFYGDGVEQARLSDVLTKDVSLPILGALERPSTAASKTALAQTLRTLRAELAAARTDQWPLSGWREFSGEGFDPAVVATALDSAATRLARGGGEARSASPNEWSRRARAGLSRKTLAHLPESLTRFRAALSGDALPSSAATHLHSSQRPAALREAFSLLEDLCTEAVRSDDVVPLRDLTGTADQVVSAAYAWPEATRWVVLAFEGLLGRAWSLRVPTSPRRFFGGAVRLTPGPNVQGGQELPPVVGQACTMLAEQWLRCVAGLQAADAAALRVLVLRLAQGLTEADRVRLL